MIFEALQHFLNQAAPEVKALGYVREAIAIEARYGRCRTDWADHLKNCHQQIMTATAPLKSTSTLMVLGSGALHDLPIGALLAAGHSLILIDIVHLAKIQKRYKTHDRVRFVEQDVTGLVGPLFHKDSLTPLDIKNGTASFLETRFPEVDLVISLNILSQLPINLIQFAEQHDIAHTWLQSRVLPAHTPRPGPRRQPGSGNGFALGGGMELAMISDIILAGQSAKFGQPEVKVGVMPGAGGSQRLVRAVGKYNAMRLCLTGMMIGAEEAKAMGLVCEVLDDDQVMDRALEMARELATLPPLGLEHIKYAILHGPDMSLESALGLERKSMQLLMSSTDRAEATAAFLEKRKGTFTGE